MNPLQNLNNNYHHERYNKSQIQKENFFYFNDRFDELECIDVFTETISAYNLSNSLSDDD